MNLLTKTTELAMSVTLQYIEEGDFVIDATCGNGHDTLCFAKAVGESGQVLALDIQEKAMASTKALLEEHHLENVNLRQGNFAHLHVLAKEENLDYIKPSAIIFNLGYLPGGDKHLTTKEADSLAAVKAALEMVKIGGIVTIVLYCGHEEGAKEKQSILEMAEDLSAKEFHVVYTKMLNQKKNPPEILWITKKR